MAIALPAIGCYNIFVLNAGAANKSAAALAAPIDPAAFCAALTQKVFTLHIGKGEVTPQEQQEITKACGETVTQLQQQQLQQQQPQVKAK
jgi:hypothetical protein